MSIGLTVIFLLPYLNWLQLPLRHSSYFDITFTLSYMKEWVMFLVHPQKGESGILHTLYIISTKQIQVSFFEIDQLKIHGQCHD